jgi:tetratricopeptide (TPR) repeat protein
MEQGNLDEVEKLLELVWYPKLLLKPIRSNYYMIKGNIAMTKKDFDGAEQLLKQSSNLGSSLTQAEGATKLQLGMVCLQKGELKQAEGYIRAAIRIGLPDKENEAVAYLYMAQIFFNKQQMKPAKDFLRKCKDCKPKNKEILGHIKDIETSLSRMPTGGGLRY